LNAVNVDGVMASRGEPQGLSFELMHRKPLLGLEIFLIFVTL
jgi:hypothetical protein